jgi:hypothetical protein
MPPTTRGAHRRLARQLREATLRATPAELAELHRLDRLVRCEALTVHQARDILRDVLRQQHERAR